MCDTCYCPSKQANWRVTLVNAGYLPCMHNMIHVFYNGLSKTYPVRTHELPLGFKAPGTQRTRETLKTEGEGARLLSMVLCQQTLLDMVFLVWFVF